MIIVVLAVFVALCGGGIALAEMRDRPVRRALRAAQAGSQN